jgi:hypothetical protein
VEPEPRRKPLLHGCYRRSQFNDTPDQL